MNYAQNKPEYKFEVVSKHEFKSRPPLYKSILLTNDLLHVKAVLKSISRHIPLLHVSLLSYENLKGAKMTTSKIIGV
jgi:hypothetical protein